MPICFRKQLVEYLQIYYDKSPPKTSSQLATNPMYFGHTEPSIPIENIFRSI